MQRHKSFQKMYGMLSAKEREELNIYFCFSFILRKADKQALEKFVFTKELEKR